jgi:hypothetical protein
MNETNLSSVINTKYLGLRVKDGLVDIIKHLKGQLPWMQLAVRWQLALARAQYMPTTGAHRRRY